MNFEHQDRLSVCYMLYIRSSYTIITIMHCASIVTSLSPEAPIYAFQSFDSQLHLGQGYQSDSTLIHIVLSFPRMRFKSNLTLRFDLARLTEIQTEELDAVKDRSPQWMCRN